MQPMKIREAKDFLAQEIDRQASIDGVTLSQIEKRMLYFTEGKSAVEDPIALNEEFEAHCDTAKYEEKISHLMHHAYKRLRNDGSSGLQTWDQAIKKLRRGDHYLLVMWDQRPGFHASGIVGYAIAALAFALFLGLRLLTHRVAPPNPRWIQAVLLVIIACFVFFPKALGDAFGWVVDKSLFWLHPEKEDD